MANSTTHIDTIYQNQASKEVTANAFFDAASPATLYGRRASACSGNTWGYYGGAVLVNGVHTEIANGTVTLTLSTTNYVEASPLNGQVYLSLSGFTAGRIPLYTVVMGASTVTSYTDHRIAIELGGGLLAKALPSDANYTLTQPEARNDILQITGSPTATRDIVVPLIPKQWTVYNGTGQSLRFIGASGTGITVATGKRAIIYADGTNVVRVTADV